MGNDTAKSDGVPPRMGVAALSYQEVAYNYFRSTWGNIRNAAKILARITGASPRTTRGWLTGETAPVGNYMIALMAREPRFKSVVSEMEAQSAFEADQTKFNFEILEIGKAIDECRRC